MMLPALMIVLIILLMMISYYYIWPFILQILAVSFMKNGDYAKAAQVYDKVLKIAPKLAKVWYIRGLLMKKLQKQDEAIHDFDIASQLSPRHLEAASEAVLLFMESGRYEEALNRINQVISSHSRPLNSILTRSSIQIQLENFEEAIQDCDWILDHDSEGAVSAGAVNNRGLARLGLGNFRDALADFELALLLDSRLTVALAHMAGCWQRQGESKNAIRLCDRILAEDPHCGIAWYYRSLAWKKEGNQEQADLDLQEAEKWGYPDFAPLR